MDRQLRRLQGTEELITPARPATNVPSTAHCVRSRSAAIGVRRPRPSQGRLDSDGRNCPLPEQALVVRRSG